jgi:hypothetical protein
MQVLVETDKAKLQKSLSFLPLADFARLIMKCTLTDIASPLHPDDITLIKERRLTSKLFTILIRDFKKSFTKPIFKQLLEDLL